MNLTELKNTPVSELITLGENMGLENLARMRKQDIIFSILKQHAKSGEDIFGDGVLEILQDRRRVLASLEQALSKDKVKTTINGFSQLGLVEMTRKRTRESLEHVLPYLMVLALKKVAIPDKKWSHGQNSVAPISGRCIG